MHPALLSSADMAWETPQAFYDALAARYNFELDVCATDATAKCPDFISPAEDGLAVSWEACVCWMNPPYGRDLPKWIDKAIHEAARGATVGILVPARTDTQWFARAYAAATSVHFVRGRLKFGGAKAAAPFPSAVLVLDRPGVRDEFPRVGFLDTKGNEI